MTPENVPGASQPACNGEPTDESCISVLHFLRKPGTDLAQQRLLMADYAARRTSVALGLRAELDHEFFQSQLPDPGELRSLGALTAAAQEAVSVEDSFAAEGVGAEVGIPIDDDQQPVGAPAVGEAAHGHRSALGERPLSSPRSAVDVAIIAAAGVDFRAVREVFRPLAKSPVDGGQRIYRAQVARENSAGELRVAILPRAGLSAFDVFQFCDPAALFLVGSATGDRRLVKRGDVVVPRAVRRHPESPDQLLIPEDMSYSLDCYDPVAAGFRREIAALLKRLRRHRPRLPPRFQPRVLLDAAIVTSGAPHPTEGGSLGHATANDNEFPIAAMDRDSWDFGSASNGRWWAVLKGVSDFGDTAANPDNKERWRHLAASTAAICLRNFLQKEYVPPQGLVF